MTKPIMKRKKLFITGTDTDVGKTLVASGLLHRARQKGLTTLGLKPVAAGCELTEEGLRNSDALALQALCEPEVTYQEVNPVALQAAIAPHIAAREEGKMLSADRLIGFCRGAMMRPVDFALIEGAGGWRVPLNDREFLSDVARGLECEVILVVGMRLGCLNHALLSAEAIRRDGLQLVGWVANILDPAMPRLDENIKSLRRSLAAPCLGELPRLDQPSAELASRYLHLPGELQDQSV